MRWQGERGVRAGWLGRRVGWREWGRTAGVAGRMAREASASRKRLAMPPRKASALQTSGPMPALAKRPTQPRPARPQRCRTWLVGCRLSWSCSARLPRCRTRLVGPRFRRAPIPQGRSVPDPARGVSAFVELFGKAAALLNPARRARLRTTPPDKAAALPDLARRALASQSLAAVPGPQSPAQRNPVRKVRHREAQPAGTPAPQSPPTRHPASQCPAPQPAHPSRPVTPVPQSPASLSAPGNHSPRK